MCVTSRVFHIFFVKQKTAYELRISDWSSDVCSSDLLGTASGERHHAALAGELQRVGQQVEQRLTQAAAVSHQFAGIVVAREAQIDAAAVGALAPQGIDRLQQRVHISRLQIELEIAGLDGSKIENVVNEDRKSTRLNTSH